VEFAELRRELALDSSPGTRNSKYLILNKLVALTGIEPVFAAFLSFLQVTETANAGSANFAGS
jgi:hypothetical protein